MSSIKEAYNRFRQWSVYNRFRQWPEYIRFRRWQEKPFEYRDSEARRTCCNCGNQFASNYCPRCGQRAIFGPINWQNVWQGIMDMWGIGSRSMPYSLWQLMWRPGYLMRDYISGKRMVSFPPVKMLVVMALVLFVLNNLLGIHYDETTSYDYTNAYELIQAKIIVWMGQNISWTVLMAFSLVVIPVWIVFRHAPRFPRHTLPQGFYVQVFIGVQFLMFMSLIVLLFSLIPPLSGDGDTALNVMVSVVLPIMALIDLKQLFGYGWLDTLWRMVLCGLLSLLICKLLFAAGGIVYYWPEGDKHEIAKCGMKCINHLSSLWVLFEMVNIINSKPWRNAHWPKTLWRPLLSLVTLLLVAFISWRLGYDNTLQNLIETFKPE